ncbi:MAG: hypothetical protein KDD56_02195 [Bdellovibrionales bacterium]|nr:hypothetical protein [Bdellovibrionales bacterium]
MYYKNCFTALAFGLAFLASPMAFAQELDFQKIKRKRPLKINCAVVNGAKFVKIRNKGAKVALQSKFKKQPLALGATYKFFACGTNENSKAVLYAKKKVSSTAVELSFSLDDFKKEVNACKNKQPVNDGDQGYLHKPVSDNTGSIVNLFKKGQRPSNCLYKTPKGKTITTGFFAGIQNGDRVHIRPTNNARCSQFPNNLILECTLNGQRACWQHKDPCNRYD